MHNTSHSPLGYTRVVCILDKREIQPAVFAYFRWYVGLGFTGTYCTVQMDLSFVMALANPFFSHIRLHQTTRTLDGSHVCLRLAPTSFFQNTKWAEPICIPSSTHTHPISLVRLLWTFTRFFSQTISILKRR